MKKIKEKEKNFISVVVYIHNCERNIVKFIEFIKTYFSSRFNQYEIIFVNDASNDKSVDIIEDILADENEEIVTIINMSYRQGVEQSMNAGVDFAIGDYVFEFDDTLINYDERIIDEVYSVCLDGVDIVSACPKRNNFISSIFYRVYNRKSQSKYSIQTDTFRLLSRRAINRVKQMSATIPYRKVIYANCGLKNEAVMYDANQKSRKKLMDYVFQVKTAEDVLILYTDVAYKFSVLFSVLMSLFILIVAIYSVVIYLNGRTVEGWTPIILFLSVGFWGGSVLLSIVIKYAALILRTVFEKQRYVIESINKVGKK